MRTHGYSTDELCAFYAVLDRAVRESAEREIEVSIPLMVQRLFHAADLGERDAHRLLDAIFMGFEPAQRVEAA
jgi:hypothetical protein